MEDLIDLSVLEKSDGLLTGRIFTRLQLDILKKKLRKESLNNNEKTYYYKFIKPKIRAMMAFFEINELNIKGKEHIIESRILRATELLSKMKKKHKNKKIMISGSFLFNKNYNDIDVFVFTKYRKEDYIKGKIHVVFLPESSLDSMFFASISQISISNFSYTPNNDFRIDLKEMLQEYEILINHILNKEEYAKELRTFLLKTEYVSKSIILNPKQLYKLKNRLKNQKSSEILSNMFINTLLFGYKKRMLMDKLRQHIKGYAKLIKEYNSPKNLKVYTQTYRKVIELGT